MVMMVLRKKGSGSAPRFAGLCSDLLDRAMQLVAKGLYIATNSRGSLEAHAVENQLL